MPASTAACVAALAAGVGLAGCGTTSSSASNQGVTVPGTTLSIDASRPSAGGGGQVAGDVFDAEQLAFSQSGADKVAGFHLRLVAIADHEVSADARAAVSDKTAIAYVGEIEPGTSGVSTQITNELGLLQVSPTDTAAYLTRAVPAVKNSPGHFYPSHSTFKATFARVVPNTVAEAKALVARMGADGVKTLAVSDDGSDYGATVAAEVRSAAAAASITVSSGATGATGAGAAFYAGLPGAAATRALDGAAAAGAKRLFAPSALYDDTFVAGLSAAAQKALTVSAPGFLPSALNSVGRGFVQSFQSRFHHAPAPQAIFGYEAMRAVIAALSEAGSHAAVRATVVTDFRDLHRTSSTSALGAYAINGGNTNIAPFVFATASGGRLVPRAAG